MDWDELSLIEKYRLSNGMKIGAPKPSFWEAVVAATSPRALIWRWKTAREVHHIEQEADRYMNELPR